jgi:sugar lactone lactonase YvrE
MKRHLTIALAALAAACALGAGAAQAHPAAGIVVDREGRVYFSDLVRVWRVDARGNLSTFRDGKDLHTHELFIDEAGNVYGTDSRYDPATESDSVAVWRMTPAGEFKYLLAPTADPPRGLGMWRDRAGNTFAWERSDYRKRGAWLVRRSPGGEVTRLAGSDYGHADGRGEKASFGITRFTALGPDGSVYVTDESYVRRVSPDGTVTTVAADIRNDRADKPEERGAPAYLSGIGVDPQGSVYVADFSGGRVIRIAPDRKTETVFSSERPWTPNGVVWGGGALYVMEFYSATERGPFHTRVRKLSPDGTSTVLATVRDGAPQPADSPAAPAAQPAPKSAAPEGGRTGRVAVPAFVGAGALALTLVAWRVRRRGSRPGAGG